MSSDLLAAPLKLYKAGCYCPAPPLPFMLRYHKQAAAERACDRPEPAEPSRSPTAPLSFQSQRVC
jgi:hypothetical protein